MRLVQESDELAYRCAFACQKTGYIVITTKGSHKFGSTYTKTKLVNYFKTKGKALDVDYKLCKYLILEPWHVVKHTLKKMIERLWEIDHPEFPKISEVQLWLSPPDKSNFRYKVVNLMGPNGLGYKAGRGEKPYYLSLIRELLIEQYGAKEIPGYEADDALGMNAGKGVILSHIDKDMNMIEGWHYNHVTQEVYYIEPGLGTVEIIEGKTVGGGFLFFYLQLLTGDAIDNIPGCKNPLKCHHAKPPNFSGAEAVKRLQGVTTEGEAWNIVAEMFQWTYEDNWVKAVMECADLLFIVRDEGVTGRMYLHNKGFV